MTADLDAIMERRRDDAASVDTCACCETPHGDLSRVAVDLAAFLGTSEHAMLCATCRVEAVREMDAELDEPEEPAPTLPLDLDGAALRALRALCAADYAARIAWSRWGVTVALVGVTGMVAQSTDATIADAVRSVAEILGREVPEIHAARAALGSAPTMAPPNGQEGTDV